MRDTLFGGGGLLLLCAIIARVRDRKQTPEHQARVKSRDEKVQALKQQRAEARAARR